MKKDKLVMTTFFMSGLADIGSTIACLNRGMREVGIMGAEIYKTDNMYLAYSIRMAVTACFVGAYAIAKEHPGRFTFSVDKAVKIGNMVSWGVVAFNTAQIIDMVIR